MTWGCKRQSQMVGDKKLLHYYAKYLDAKFTRYNHGTLYIYKFIEDDIKCSYLNTIYAKIIFFICNLDISKRLNCQAKPLHQRKYRRQTRWKMTSMKNELN